MRGKREKEKDRSNGPITAILQILAKHPWKETTFKLMTIFQNEER